MIDRQTIDRIKETANIVDVVSEFVTLRKSGANYKGLCPFHNEKTPSFFVTPARNTCHCFGCGRGGNPVSFIMEHEQMTYPEALRWLANKYHIEIRERELTNEEKEAESERQSMFIVNEWASKYFEDLLHNNPDGQAIGLQYFRSRGFRDDIIRRFQLGFDLPDRFALAKTAKSKGYKEDFLVKTGICYRNDRGDLVDRYAGRVIFPWIGVSGKVVGFGGRKLDAATKGVQQKYVNSPDSDIYHKDHELYGIYQAKKAIAREDMVYMVEGYTDVIAMHQCGIENVVANSGTALSLHQIRILHRFTQNITLLYDGDEAGIHAAMRGTDMLLSEGMNMKVLLLPDGDDPDSFSRKHTASDFKKYIEEHQTDFIQFKTDLLLRGERDPQKRSEAISSIVQSISVIPDQILRDTYIHDCSMRMGINEATLINTMNNFIRSSRERSQHGDETTVQPAEREKAPGVLTSNVKHAKGEENIEALIAQMVVRDGEVVIVKNVEDENGKSHDLNVAQLIYVSLNNDGLTLSDNIYRQILEEAVEHSDEPSFRSEEYFLSHHDVDVSRIATQLAYDSYLVVEQEEEQQTDDEKQIAEEKRRSALFKKVNHLLLDFKLRYIDGQLKILQQQIVDSHNDKQLMFSLMSRYKEMQGVRNELAKSLGNNIIN